MKNALKHLIKKMLVDRETMVFPLRVIVASCLGFFFFFFYYLDLEMTWSKSGKLLITTPAPLLLSHGLSHSVWRAVNDQVQEATGTPNHICCFRSPGTNYCISDKYNHSARICFR